MYSFAEVQFPPNISYGSKGGPLFSTEVIETFSGHEQRNINWREARARYDVATGVKSREEWQELIAFFRARRGRAIGFRYKDWADYVAINQRIGKGDGVKNEFQLVKHYINSNYFYTRKITKPVNNGNCHIYVDGVAQQTQNYVVDYTKGLVSFNQPLREDEVISADFEFDVPVRFDSDHLDLSMEDYGVASCSSIPLVEIRVDELGNNLRGYSSESQDSKSAIS